MVARELSSNGLNRVNNYCKYVCQLKLYNIHYSVVVCF